LKRIKNQNYFPNHFLILARMPLELVDFWDFLLCGVGGREIVRFGAGASFTGISLSVPFGSSPDGSKPHANPIL
jgi:hypothetical protein